MHIQMAAWTLQGDIPPSHAGNGSLDNPPSAMSQGNVEVDSAFNPFQMGIIGRSSPFDGSENPTEVQFFQMRPEPDSRATLPTERSQQPTQRDQSEHESLGIHPRQ